MPPFRLRSCRVCGRPHPLATGLRAGADHARADHPAAESRLGGADAAASRRDDLRQRERSRSPPRAMSRSTTATTRCSPTRWSTTAARTRSRPQGNVRIKDPDGAVITADQITLTDDFRDGFIDALEARHQGRHAHRRVLGLARGRQRHGVRKGMVHALQSLRGKSEQAAHLAHSRRQDHPQARPGHDHLSGTPSSTSSACRSSTSPTSRWPTRP